MYKIKAFNKLINFKKILNTRIQIKNTFNKKIT